MTPYGNHWDLYANTDWGKWIHLNGPHNFFTYSPWAYTKPTQLPLIDLIYAYNNIISEKIVLFGNNSIGESFKIGQFISMKIIPIFADIGIGIVIFIFGSRYVGIKTGLLTSLIYLYSPFTFYLSSLWGQYDQLSTLFLLLAFLVVYWRVRSKHNLNYLYLVISSLFYFISIEVKPLALFVAPLFLYYIYKQNTKLVGLILAVVLIFGLFIVTSIPFVTGNVFPYLAKVIIPSVIYDGSNFVSIHAFNFWGLVSPSVGDSIIFPGFGKQIIFGRYLIIVALNIISIFIVSKKDSLKNILLGIFIVVGGSFIFTLGMVERYYFSGIVLFLFLTMFNKKTLSLWIMAAILFFLNLLLAWGYPFDLLIPTLFWNMYPLVSLLSGLQIIVFLSSVILCLRDNEN